MGISDLLKPGLSHHEKHQISKENGAAGTGLPAAAGIICSVRAESGGILTILENQERFH